MDYIEPELFLSRASRIPIIDVRSPGEYEKAHISGAYNLSLFNDMEREKVGILYTRKGQQAAIDEGMKIVAPKLDSFEQQAHKLAKNNQLLIHCWRGGMRSERMALFLEESGLKCSVLRGGYKAYRKKLREDFANIKTLFVLEGPTGSGKTEILHKMSILGEQVLDLENLARHRGSTFGWIGKGNQPSTSQFQNDVHSALIQLRKDRPVWVEGESLKIGKVTLPEALWYKMNNAPIFNIEMDVEKRAKRIVDEYGSFSKQELLTSLEKIKSRLGDLNYKRVSGFIGEGDLEAAVLILLGYYDKAYYHSLKTNRKIDPVNIELASDSTLESAKKIIRIAGKRENDKA